MNRGYQTRSCLILQKKTGASIQPVPNDFHTLCYCLAPDLPLLKGVMQVTVLSSRTQSSAAYGLQPRSPELPRLALQLLGHSSPKAAGIASARKASFIKCLDRILRFVKEMVYTECLGWVLCSRERKRAGDKFSAGRCSMHRTKVECPCIITGVIQRYITECK